MRYEYHNFVDNYKNIKKSKDMAMTRELVVSEISKVIDGRPFLVKRALVSCGISLSNEADKTEIVFVTMFNLAQSECLRRSMAELIYNNQYPVIADRDKELKRNRKDLTDFDTDKSMDEFMYSNGGGSGSSGGSGGGGSAGDYISGITQLIGVTFGVVSQNKNIKNAREQRAHEMELAQMNSELALAQMNLDASMNNVQPVQEARFGGGGSMVTYLLVGLGVVGLIGFAIYSSRKQAATA